MNLWLTSSHSPQSIHPVSLFSLFFSLTPSFSWDGALACHVIWGVGGWGGIVWDVLWQLWNTRKKTSASLTSHLLLSFPLSFFLSLSPLPTSFLSCCVTQTDVCVRRCHTPGYGAQCVWQEWQALDPAPMLFGWPSPLTSLPTSVQLLLPVAIPLALAVGSTPSFASDRSLPPILHPPSSHSFFHQMLLFFSFFLRLPLVFLPLAVLVSRKAQKSDLMKSLLSAMLCFTWTVIGCDG